MYALGVILAVLSGIVHNSGMLLQKKAVNDVVAAGRPRFYRSLLRHPVWLTGLLLGMGLGTTLFLLAQALIGPALIPGLMASGLVVLVLGSVGILREGLALSEGAGILLLVAGVYLLGLSGVAIDLREYDVLAASFLGRAALYSAVALGAIAALEATRRLGRRRGSASGLALAVVSGLHYSLSNFWVGPFVAVVMRIFAGELSAPVLGMFAWCALILPATNVFGIGRLQAAFRTCRASRAVPLQQVPVQVGPAFVYLAVFRMRPPSTAAVLLLGAGIVLILSSSFLLGGRQGALAGLDAPEEGSLEP